MLRPYWWTEDWTDEEKRIAGNPQNRIDHMERAKPRVDEYERDIDRQMHNSDDDVFGPTV